MRVALAPLSDRCGRHARRRCTLVWRRSLPALLSFAIAPIRFHHEETRRVGIRGLYRCSPGRYCCVSTTCRSQRDCRNRHLGGPDPILPRVRAGSRRPFHRTSRGTISQTFPCMSNRPRSPGRRCSGRLRVSPSVLQIPGIVPQQADIRSLPERRSRTPSARSFPFGFGWQPKAPPIQVDRPISGGPRCPHIGFARKRLSVPALGIRIRISLVPLRKSGFVAEIQRQNATASYQSAQKAAPRIRPGTAA